MMGSKKVRMIFTAILRYECGEFYTLSVKRYRNLEDPSHHTPFLMPRELLILHGESKFYCFTVGKDCVPESFSYRQ